MASSNLYVKLDASYHDDQKILEAGEKAELLYVRGLCLAKRILSDGFVADVHLPLFGLTSAQGRARKLVEVGLWQRDDAARGYWITSWLKHNTSKDEVEAIREGGARGNHVRWHVRERKPSSECPYCIAEGLAPRSPPDSPPDSPKGIPEAEAEAEAEQPSSPDQTKPKGGSRKRAHQLPDDWSPSDELLAEQRTKHPNVNLERELEKFRNHWRSKGETRKDWSATWRNWVIKAEEFGGGARASPKQLHNVAEITTGGRF